MTADRNQPTVPLPANKAVRSGNDAATEPVHGDAATARWPEQIDRGSGPAAAPAPAWSGPGTRIGQYELIRALGQGGMGEVFLARDLRLGRLVAIKRLSKPGPGLAECFLREARTTARCMHENIVVIHEVGEQDGDPYMVLEYLEGASRRRSQASPRRCHRPGSWS